MHRRLSSILALFGILILFSGCPDTSHLRAVPDYSLQRDSHGGDPGKEQKDRDDKSEEQLANDEDGRESP